MVEASVHPEYLARPFSISDSRRSAAISSFSHHGNEIQLRRTLSRENPLSELLITPVQQIAKSTLQNFRNHGTRDVAVTGSHLFASECTTEGLYDDLRRVKRVIHKTDTMTKQVLKSHIKVQRGRRPADHAADGTSGSASADGSVAAR